MPQCVPLRNEKSNNSKSIRRCVENSACILSFNFYNKLLPCTLILSLLKFKEMKLRHKEFR